MTYAKRITQSQIDRLFLAVNRGATIRVAAMETGMSYTKARQLVKGYRTTGDFERGQFEGRYNEVEQLGRPLENHELSNEAKRAKDDFVYFRERYFGRKTPPWQRKAAELAQERLHTPEETYDIWNMPPGAGKSSLAHDLGAFSIVHDRRIKVCFGSLAARLAEKQGERLRRSLERTIPPRASLMDERLGLALDAKGVLATDFGVFRPVDRIDRWRSSEFVVVQRPLDGTIDEKEATVTCIGMDTIFIGNRFDLIFWDDLVDRSTTATIEIMEKQREWWDSIAEARLDPGGAMFLIGQRIAPQDLYRYNLDKRRLMEEMGEEEDVVNRIAYKHTVFPAHDDLTCQGNHGLDAPSQGEEGGCLLDPPRLTYPKLMSKKAANEVSYATVYQQEDRPAGATTVSRIWVDGGIDPKTGTQHFGCWDEQRILCEAPKNLKPPLVSVAAVDPSGTKFWALQWWLYAPNNAQQLFLMDVEDVRMNAPDLLDFRPEEDRWVGFMEAWQVRSKELGYPIAHWIVEINAAQRYLLQYNHVQRWMSQHKVDIVPHATARNKADADLGIESLASWWRSGRIRLPGGSSGSRVKVKPLVDQVTTHPHGTRDDQVMANWFTTFRLPALTPGRAEEDEPQRRPSWMRRSA